MKTFIHPESMLTRESMKGGKIVDWVYCAQTWEINWNMSFFCFYVVMDQKNSNNVCYSTLFGKWKICENIFNISTFSQLKAPLFRVIPEKAIQQRLKVLTSLITLRSVHNNKNNKIPLCFHKKTQKTPKKPRKNSRHSRYW